MARCHVEIVSAALQWSLIEWRICGVTASEHTGREFLLAGNSLPRIFFIFLFYIWCAQRIIAPYYTAQHVWCRSEMESSLYGTTQRWEVAQTCFKYHFHFDLLLQLINICE